MKTEYFIIAISVASLWLMRYYYENKVAELNQGIAIEANNKFVLQEEMEKRWLACPESTNSGRQEGN